MFMKRLMYEGGYKDNIGNDKKHTRMRMDKENTRMILERVGRIQVWY